MLKDNFIYLPRLLVLKMISVYQKTLSPDHGLLKPLHPYGYCKFTPTCSEYSYQAVEKHGLIKGVWLGTRRLFRCHPWSKGGHDPVR